MRQRIFIGSSSEQLHVARAIHADLSENHEPTIWNQGIFGLSQDVLSGLLEHLAQSDAAVLVLAPDDLSCIRGSEFKVSRDNVLFELGLFMGRLGRERTYFVVPHGSDLHLPSDLLGLVAARYDANRSDGNWKAAVAPACDDIRQALEKAALRSQSDQSQKPDTLGEGLAWMHEYVNKAFKMFLTHKDLPTLEVCEIRALNDGYRTKLGRAEVTVRFGRIEACDATEPGCVVALPTNEFFDDECVNDTHSALGAYVQAAFPGKVHELQRLIAENLARERPILVEREPNQMGKSYGIAKCVYLNSALSSNKRIIFVSVTTKRAGVGLRSEAHYLFAAMKAICREMNDRKLWDLHVPLMGSGHGGLECELALLYLLLALKAVLNDSSVGTHLRSVTIIVFQKDARSCPSVSREAAGRILSVAKASA